MDKKKIEEKRVEEELRKYRLIVESAQDAIFVKDLDSHYILVNQKTIEAFGKSKREEVLGKRDDELLPPKQAKINIEDDQKVFKTGKPKEVTKKMTAGGKERWFQAKKVPLRDNQGKIIGLIGVARDITERKRAEEVLRESDEKLQYIIDNTWDIIFHINLEGNYTFGNKAAEKITGYPIDKLLRMNMYELVAPEYHQFLRERMKKRIAGELLEQPFDFEIVHKDGHRVTVELTTTGIRDKNRKLVGVQGIARDITERKKAEKRVRESEKKYRSMVEVTTDWVWEVDRDGVYTYVSPKVKDILGYEVDEVIGKTPFDLMPEDEAKKISKFFREKIIKKEPFFRLKNVNRHKKGHLVVLETNGMPILDERGDLVGYRGIDRDITERKEMEEKIRVYAQAIEGAYDAFVITDREWKIVFANQSVLDMYGYRRDELINKHVSIFPPESELKQQKEALREAETRGSWSGELINKRKNGEEFPIILSLSLIKNEKNEVVGALSIFRDIAETKKLISNLEKTKAELTAKIEDLERFERVTVDRELKMIELKKRIEELEKQLKMSGNKSVEER